jgi:ABC-type multidrug transport system fused ATPase/permease subunit
VAAGAMQLGDLIAFLLYLFYLSEPIASLVQGVTQLQQGLAAVGRIEEVAGLPVEEEEPDEEDGPRRAPGAAPPADPLVAFEGVRFRYRGDRERVLHDVSFAVPARGLTALVGPSGAGKTTLFALLERFYEPEAGRIAFAGRDLRAWPAALRAHLG